MLDPWDVGDPMTLGMAEEELVADVRGMAEAARRGEEVRASDVEALLDSYGVAYGELPAWMHGEIDAIDLAD